MSAFVVIGMVTLPPGSDGAAFAAALMRAGAALLGVRSAWAAPIVRQVAINAGDVVLRLTFGHVQHERAIPDWPMLDGLPAVWLGYAPGKHGGGPEGAGIWRALVFRCFADADPALVAQLEQATLRLPDAIAEIRNWALSRVAWTHGAEPFGWVWEQEFAQVADLTGPYMTAPLHWGLVDAFFDADCPEYVVDPHLVQVVGAIDRTIMGDGQ